MFNHICVGTNDLARAKVFYDAIFASMGAGAPIEDTAKGRLIYRHDGGAFLVCTPINGEPASVGNGGTIGLKFASGAAIDAWHAAGIAHGGTTCEDPPGIRSNPQMTLYLGYLRDPDGNKLCAIHVPPK